MTRATTSETPLAASARGRAWRRSLALLWCGQLVSHLGDALFLSVMFFVALQVSGSRATAGLLVGLNFTPALVLGLFAGALVDRSDRRRVMLVADLLRAASVTAIPLLHQAGWLGPTTLGAAMFCLALGSTLFNPALKAYMPQLVPLGQLTTATAAFQVAEYGALVAGPLLASFLIPRLGFIDLLYLDGASFAFSAACLVFLPRLARAGAVAEDQAHRLSLRTARRIARDALDGARQVLAIKVVRTLLIVTTLNNLAIMGLAQVATPLLVKDTLGLGADAYSRSLQFFFLGMAVASAAFGVFGRHMRKGVAILVGIFFDGLTFVPFAFCTTLGQLAFAQFVHALFIPLIIIPRTVLIQHLVPPALHGRAFALANVTVFGMMALSSAAVGVLAERVEVPVLFVILGSVGALPGLLGLFIPGLRAAR